MQRYTFFFIYHVFDTKKLLYQYHKAPSPRHPAPLAPPSSHIQNIAFPTLAEAVLTDC